ncbi:XdhC family protein [Enterovibrio norvegicus]|uniref:XdhC family protein n=1 Tax=Enterovibrio norvegicus TaxID=188144 RepID=UPI00352DD9EC
MSNHLLHLLSQWYPEKDNAEWVLGTVFNTHGPCYRKAGAMMFFNGLGQQLGMLSGGCLESDIQRHAKKVMDAGDSVTLIYDSQDEDDLSFQLGIGCGGTVEVMLQPLSAANNYLALEEVYTYLMQRQSGHFYQRIPTKNADRSGSQSDAASFIPSEQTLHYVSDGDTLGKLIKEGEQDWLRTYVQPPVHLLIAGGGLDTKPLATLASQLGWHVSLWDPRPANARREYFQTANAILRGPAESLSAYCLKHRVDAAVVMTHNVTLDAQVLLSLRQTQLRYLALLGPTHRRDDVLTAAEIKIDDLPCHLSGPAGLHLGAALPEGIAMSILAECMARLNDASGASFSGSLS